MALADRGDDAVLARVGVEPSGNPFNSVTVDAESSRPFNPMVNAGAIVTTALIEGVDPHDRLERILETFSRFAGRELADRRDGAGVGARAPAIATARSRG